MYVTGREGCYLTLLGPTGTIEKVFDVSKDMKELIKQETKSMLKEPSTVEQLLPQCRLELSDRGL
jgi:hypothetical protein